GREAGDTHQPDRLGRRTRDDLHAGEGKGTGRRKSRKIRERSWKFRAAADEGNARMLIGVTTAQRSWVSPARRFTIAALRPRPHGDGQLDPANHAWPAC